jgi:hypothetical protein
MYLRDISIYAQEEIVDRYPPGFVGWFHRETCCITDLYCSLLGKRVATPNTAKVNLLFVEQEGLAPTIKQLINVADVRWGFEFAEYANRDVEGKKQMVLDALQAALRWIGTQRNWETRGLEDCYADVIRRNLRFEGWSKKSWINPNPKYRARIGFLFGLRTVEFFVGLFDRRGREVGRKPLGSVAPEMGMAQLVLKGSARWIKGKVFRLQIADAYFHLPRSWEVNLAELLI